MFNKIFYLQFKKFTKNRIQIVLNRNIHSYYYKIITVNGYFKLCKHLYINGVDELGRPSTGGNDLFPPKSTHTTSVPSPFPSPLPLTGAGHEPRKVTKRKRIAFWRIRRAKQGDILIRFFKIAAEKDRILAGIGSSVFGALMPEIGVLGVV